MGAATQIESLAGTIRAMSNYGARHSEHPVRHRYPTGCDPAQVTLARPALMAGVDAEQSRCSREPWRNGAQIDR